MCDPLTMAIIGGGAQAAGTGLNIKSSMDSAKFNKQMAENQAAMNRARAVRAQQTGELNASEASLRRRQLVATGAVALAGNGILIDANPASAGNLWEQDQAAQLALERQIIRDNADAEAWGYVENSRVQVAQGKMASHSGQLQAWGASIKPMAQGASALAGGIGGASSAVSANSSANASQTN